MKHTCLATLFVAVTFSFGLLGAPALAASVAHQQYAAMHIADNRVSAKQAAKRAQRQHGGRVLSVKLKNADAGNAYYAVKLIKNGKVSIVSVPAN